MTHSFGRAFSGRRSRNSTLECSAGLPLKEEAPAERSTKSEQLELTKEAKGEQSYLKSRSNERERVGRLANRLDRVGRLFE